MKKNYLKLVAAALFMTVSTVACSESASDDDNTTDGTQDEELNDFMTETPFTLKSEEITPIGFTLSVDCGDYTDLYYVGCVQNSTLNDEETYAGDIEAYATDFIADIAGDQYQVTDFTVVDNFKIFQSDAKVDMALPWGQFIEPSAELTAFVFGVNEYGEISSKVASIEVTIAAQTEPIDESPAVKEVLVEANQITVEVTPVEGITQYMVGAFQAKDFEDGGYYSTMETSTGTDMWLIAAEEIIFIKTDVADSNKLFTGTQEIVLTQHSLNNSFSPNAEYSILAFGVDEYGYPSSQVGHINVTTPAAATSDMTFDISFDDTLFTDDGFTFTVTPSNLTEWYYVSICTKAELDAVGGEDATSDQIYSIFKNYGVEWDLTYGEQTKEYGGLSVCAEYYVVAFAYNGGITSVVSLTACETGAWQSI